MVKESFGAEQTPHRVHGATARGGQVVGIDCAITTLYDVRESTGSALLAQSYLVHLRTRPVPRGTAYELDCTGPLIVEIPTDASDVQATSTSASGRKVALRVQAPVTSLPLEFGKRLRAERRTQFAVIDWPRTLSPRDHRVELAFGLSKNRVIREKALYTVSVSCGGSVYLQPILPLVASMARAPAFTIQPSAKVVRFSPPRIAAANGTHAEATRTLSCGH